MDDVAGAPQPRPQRLQLAPNVILAPHPPPSTGGRTPLGPLTIPPPIRSTR